MSIRFSSQDEANQEAVASFLAKAWACNIWRIADTTAAIDYVAAREEPGRERPQVTAFIEIKCNSGTLSDLQGHGQVWIDDNKVQAFCTMYSLLKAPSIYVVSREDGLVFFKWSVDVSPFKTHHVGRKDRGEPADVRLAHRVPLSSFRVMKYAGAIHANRASA